MDLIPVALFWGLAIWAFFGRSRRLLYLFFATMPFGSFAVIPTAMTGGFTLTATPIVAALLVARQFTVGGEFAHMLGLALRPSRLLLLFLVAFLWTIGSRGRLAVAWLVLAGGGAVLAAVGSLVQATLV